MGVCVSVFIALSCALACAGPIPETLGDLTNLKSLNLSNNKLTGKPISLACARAPPI